MVLQLKKSVDDLWPVRNKKVLMRVDYNVPIHDGVISNDYRVRSTLPTIRKILNQGGSVILMSHLGRPKGVSFEEIRKDAAKRKYYAETWIHEHGSGKTSFFAQLSGDDKKLLLSWSSMADKALALETDAGSGKTYLFSTLPEHEKKQLLDRLTKERRQEVNFPHLRQYKGYEEELSLHPVAVRLEALLKDEGISDLPVLFAEDCLDAQTMVDKLRPGQALLLENVRFYRNESSKRLEERMAMAEQLASYGDFFVSDAFGTAHRDAASMTGIPKVLGHGASGYLMKREIEAFHNVIVSKPPSPVVAIVGGAKVSDKVQLLENMLGNIDKLIIGGAMAYTFLKAKGFNIGKSFCERGQSFIDRYSGESMDIVELASKLLKKADERGIDIYLPVDHVCHTACKATEAPLTTEDANVPDDYMALDIGPQTISLYHDVIGNCNTAIWNGPMGVFEIPTYSAGTFAVAKAMGDGTADRGMMTIIGGGDSASAAEQSGQAVRMSHVSTGGGASLELLEGKSLPGIAALDDVHRPVTNGNGKH